MLGAGEDEASLAKQAVRAGEAIPDAIANAPRLFLGSNLYLQAFFELDGERHHGAGLMPIPRRAIVEYAYEHAFDSEQLEDACYLIRLMDNAHLKRLGEQMNNG